MKVYRNVISVLFFAISVYVLILNIFSTCFTSANRFEFNYYCGDIFILNILAIAAAVAGAIFIKFDAVSKFANKYYIPLKAIMLTLIAVTGVVFVFGGGLGLGADQLDIQKSAPSPRFMNPNAVGILSSVPINTSAANIPHSAIRRRFDPCLVLPELSDIWFIS